MNTGAQTIGLGTGVQLPRKRPSAWDAVSDPIILVTCGVTIGVTICTMIRQHLQSAGFEELLADKVAELERARDRIRA
jgi:hypothetical protein